ncbi:MAG: STAS domain-containing protein [Gemmatimonadota bacterium]
MSFRISDMDGIVVIEVNGELIVGNREGFKQEVLGQLDDGGRKFVVDFTESSYIDSSGLGALVSLSRKIREAGGDLRLAGLNEDLSTLFELTKLNTLFQISDSRELALADF